MPEDGQVAMPTIVASPRPLSAIPNVIGSIQNNTLQAVATQTGPDANGDDTARRPYHPITVPWYDSWRDYKKQTQNPRRVNGLTSAAQSSTNHQCHGACPPAQRPSRFVQHEQSIQTFQQFAQPLRRYIRRYFECMTAWTTQPQVICNRHSWCNRHRYHWSRLTTQLRSPINPQPVSKSLAVQAMLATIRRLRQSARLPRPDMT